MPTNNYADTLILQALRHDDEKALNHLFEHHYNRLYRIGLKMGVSSDVVEEGIQTVFMDLWRYRQTLGDIQSFEAYLISSLKRRLAKQRHETNLLEIDAFDENNQSFPIESYETILIQQQTSDEMRVKIRKTLDLLTDRQKQVVVMKYFDELSYDEIAQRTGLQKDSLYKVLHEAIRRLKGFLNP
jgi:RNA polymerase sigma factor (sigma-70 family)